MLAIALPLIQIVFLLFVVCKIFTAIGKACGVSEVKNVLGESLSLGSGNLSARRED